MAEAESIIGTPDVEGAEPEQGPRSEGVLGDEKDGKADGKADRAEAGQSDQAEKPDQPDQPDQSDEAEKAAPKGPRRIAALFAVAAVAYALDLISKMIVVAKLEHHEPIDIIGDWLRFEAIRNAGAAFGMGQAFTIVFTCIAAAVIVVIVRLARKLYSLPWAIALGLLLGGALGNLTDRLFRAPGVFEGHVVDFIAPKNFAVFNLADSAIVCGGILIVILSFKGLDPDGTVHKD
ncbi:signal peptidase II [Streptomyces indicus]|uniref:Lipoprotein signal peptidase n=1 Tax=Streptomyces indicus TaxID=417292 RepID=A0A1G8YYQ7_9ACTN|nr:signal peptidase II [Streptomyces indicus]SDK07877.1 signal peptidase II [Streptomyces indicus]